MLLAVSSLSVTSGRRYKRRCGVALTIAALVVGCGGPTNDSSAQDSGTIGLHTWLISGGEKQALDAAIKVFTDSHPSVTVIKETAADAPAARAELLTKVQTANLPDTFQANIGADLIRWVYFNGMDDTESKLDPIDEFIPKQNFYPNLVKQASSNGAMYAVPMNIHRINSLFYNIALFDQMNLTPPTDSTTLEEFNALCDQIKAKGVVPLAVGTQLDWTLQELVFEDIFPGIAGASYYESYWKGTQDDALDAPVVQAIDEGLLLRCGTTRGTDCKSGSGYINPDAGDIDWQGALDEVISGQAAMTAMGDWAKGYFESKSWVAGKDFEQVQFPGQYRVFIYTSDTFSLPKGTSVGHRLAIELLQSFASKESQIQFNLFKGSIPARSDIDLGDYSLDAGAGSFDSMQRHTFTEFKSADLGLAMSGLVPYDVFTSLADVLKASLDQGSTADIQLYLRRNYPELKERGLGLP